MPSIAEVTGKRPRPLTIEVRELAEPIQIAYDASVVTPAFASELSSGVREDPLALSKGLAQVILEWNITQADGSPYEPTAENISTVPGDILGAIARGIGEDASGRAEGKASDAGSHLADSSASAPNGTTSPEQPATTAAPPAS